MKDGGWILGEKRREVHESQVERVREVTRAALEQIDRTKHAGFPKCALCGQKCRGLDQFGLCSKTSKTHMDWRAGMRADEKAGVK